MIWCYTHRQWHSTDDTHEASTSKPRPFSREEKEEGSKEKKENEQIIVVKGHSIVVVIAVVRMYCITPPWRRVC